MINSAICQSKHCNFPRTGEYQLISCNSFWQKYGRKSRHRSLGSQNDSQLNIIITKQNCMINREFKNLPTSIPHQESPIARTRSYYIFIMWTPLNLNHLIPVIIYHKQLIGLERWKMHRLRKICKDENGKHLWTLTCDTWGYRVQRSNFAYQKPSGSCLLTPLPQATHLEDWMTRN